MGVSLSSGDTFAPKVLVVDDEPHVRQVVCRWLRDAGCQCVQVEDANAAWQYLQKNEVHVLTLDVSMPGLSGLDLLSLVKQCAPDAEVIMLTAAVEAATAIEALTRGAFAYLMKPVERNELVLQVGKAVERRRFVQERRQYTRTLEDKVQMHTAAIRRAHEETILRLLSASRYRDAETGAHVKRTGLYSELFAEVLGWPMESMLNIRMAAPMHDIGKIGVPDAILRKPGRLSPEETEIMQTHTTIGAGMLMSSESAILQMACEIALCHHERWDGAGYPRGMAGEAIPESARIVALVDVYDALTHDRVYRPAMAEDETLAIMERGRGTHFDPFLFGIFLALVPQLRQIAAANPDEREGEPIRWKPLSEIPSESLRQEQCRSQTIQHAGIS
ncbi:MAG: HD domain-containing phosphohydrolase [Thermoguttaceae bacterium]|jgi:putative two-component system response regulator